MIIAARPAMGKTTLAQNILLYAAHTTQKPCVFFSLEMSGKLIAKRFASAAGINLSHLNTGDMSEEEWSVFSRVHQNLEKLPLIIYDTPRLTVADMRAKLNKIRHQHGQIGLVVVDYIGIIGGVDGDDLVNKIGNVTAQLKTIAQDFDCPVIALSQLNRGLESRPNKRPLASDLRDSGKIEEHADKILAIYRDEYYNQDTQEKGIAEFIILKNRNGATGTVKAIFEGHFSRFVGMEYSQAQASQAQADSGIPASPKPANLATCLTPLTSQKQAFAEALNQVYRHVVDYETAKRVGWGLLDKKYGDEKQAAIFWEHHYPKVLAEHQAGMTFD
ncbi:hypothetical protein A9306_04350 [Moraxella atlantae]|uniref:SF4 helicase domain-containing protein n=2 Tax=Faucicola atlantae TaxID=34059 RepID=A0A1B8QKA2_9GAMM|nr:hypothetical protein A9306_04350 [Moraxella atlantae]